MTMAGGYSCVLGSWLPVVLEVLAVETLSQAGELTGAALAPTVASLQGDPLQHACPLTRPLERRRLGGLSGRFRRGPSPG